MQRLFLPTLTVLVLVLILADRLARVPSGAVADAPETANPPVPASGPSASPGTRIARLPGETGTPTIEKLARLATRRALSAEASATYLDSLLLSTDSVLRRWPVPMGRLLRVAIVEGGPPSYAPRMSGYVREAFQDWERLGLDLQFEVVRDTAVADIVVKWISHFAINRTGQTDLTWDQFGRVQRAVITLAISDGHGRMLPSTALLSVATHEVGHSLGLPHSALPGDVMFPEPRVTDLSARDRRSILLLYQLPSGSVKDSLGA